MSLRNRPFARQFAVALAPLVAALVLVPLHRTGADALVTSAWLAVGTAAVTLWLYRRRAAPVGTRWAAPLTWATACGVIVHTVVPGVAPVLDALGAVVAATAGWLLAGPGPDLPVASPGSPLADPGHRTVWCRSVRSRRGLAAAALLVLLAGAAVLGNAIVVSAVGVIAAVVTALHTTVTIRVDPLGLRVNQVLLRRTLLAVPYDRMVRADAETTPAGLPRGDYGLVAAGPVFGYRARPHGPALRVELAGGRACVITVDDPGTAAALINSRLAAPAAEPAC